MTESVLSILGNPVFGLIFAALAAGVAMSGKLNQVAANTCFVIACFAGSAEILNSNLSIDLKVVAILLLAGLCVCLGYWTSHTKEKPPKLPNDGERPQSTTYQNMTNSPDGKQAGRDLKVE